jgi:hypothetical protein
VSRLPNETVKHPYQTQRPSNCGVTAQTSPVQQKVRTDFLSSHDGGEDNEDRGACIVCKLEEYDLGEDAGRGEVRECARSGRSASACHQC